MPLRQSLLVLAQLKYFLRAIGLELLPTLLRPRNAPEPPKPAVRYSRWIALSRCTIHVLPCTIFAFLLYLNYNPTYLGPGLTVTPSDAVVLALFQVAAKLLEITCIASLTTVLLQVLRHGLMSGGVPLGFLGSGVFFSQANYFWSPEMLVGAMHCLKNWRRMRLLIVVTVVALVAVLIAPSTAVLLLPRLQNVPAGGTNYFVPATSDQLWPDVVDGTDETQECFEGNATQCLFCPSGGFESLRSYFKNINSSFHVPSKMRWSTSSLTPIIVQVATPRVPDLQNYGSVRGMRPETTIYQPNMITAILPSHISEDWRNSAARWSGSPFSAAKQYQYALQLLSIVSTTSPVVHVKCSAAQNVSYGPTQVEFPVKLWTPSAKPGSRHWETDGKLFNTSIPKTSTFDNLLTEWIPLPSDQFGPVSGGILVSFPGVLSNDSGAVLGCSVSASWVYAKIRSDSYAYGSAWDFPNIFDIIWTSSITNNLSSSSPHAHNHPRLMSIYQRWFESLNSPTYVEDGAKYSQQPNKLQRLFSDVGLTSALPKMRTQPYNQYNGSMKSCVLAPPNLTMTDVERLNDPTCGGGGKSVLTEHIIASTIANGLSRYGAPSNLILSSPELTLFTGS